MTLEGVGYPERETRVAAVENQNPELSPPPLLIREGACARGVVRFFLRLRIQRPLVRVRFRIVAALEAETLGRHAGPEARGEPAAEAGAPEVLQQRLRVPRVLVRERPLAENVLLGRRADEVLLEQFEESGRRPALAHGDGPPPPEVLVVAVAREVAPHRRHGIRDDDAQPAARREGAVALPKDVADNVYRDVLEDVRRVDALDAARLERELEARAGARVVVEIDDDVAGSLSCCTRSSRRRCSEM